MSGGDLWKRDYAHQRPLAEGTGYRWIVGNGFIDEPGEYILSEAVLLQAVMKNEHPGVEVRIPEHIRLGLGGDFYPISRGRISGADDKWIKPGLGALLNRASTAPSFKADWLASLAGSQEEADPDA